MAEPPSANWPAAYWFWHRIPTSDEIRDQIGDMYRSGYRTFLIQPRLAFPIEEYLGPAYLEAYRLAIEEAARIGATAGIYDDYNWMSGHAGGRTVLTDDAARERHLFWSTAQLVGGLAECVVSSIEPVSGLSEPMRSWCYEGGRFEWADWEVVAVVAHPSGDQPTELADLVDLGTLGASAEPLPNGCVIRIHAPDGLPEGYEVTAFVQGRCTTSRMINYLSSTAGASFVEAGLEPYRRVVGAHFGKTIRYVFFDHPHGGFYRWAQHHGDVINSLMYDAELCDAWDRAHSEPLSHALIASLRRVGDQTARIRGAFWQVYGELARTSFFGPVADWCRRHGLDLTGHELLGHVGRWGWTGSFPETDLRANFGADYFGIDEFRTITAVDASGYEAQLSPKLGASVAKAHGRTGCIVEQYSAASEGRHFATGYWDLTLAEMRAQAIRLTLLGARQFLFHAYYQTDGEPGDHRPLASPRVDFPPGSNFEPWFGFHEAFAQEIATLSAFLDEASLQSQVAVLYPLASYWMDGAMGAFGPHGAFWHEWLATENVWYDIVDERSLLSGRIRNGALESDAGRHRVLVLPGVTTLLSTRTVDLLEAFMADGGAVIASGPLVNQTVEAGGDPGLAARLATLLGDSEAGLWLSHVPVSKGERDALLSWFRRRLTDLPRITAEGDPTVGQLWAWVGSAEEDTLVALFNDAQTARRVTYQAPGPPIRPLRHSATTGGWIHWAWHPDGAEGAMFAIDLEPNEFALFRLNPAGHLDSGQLLDASCPIIEARSDAGGLVVTLAPTAGRAAWATIRSPRRPSIAGPGIRSRVRELGPGAWEVWLEPRPAASLQLDGPWVFREDGAGVPHPIDVNRGWEAQGHEAFAGAGTYEATVTVPDVYRAGLLELRFPAIQTAVEVRINNRSIGRRGWPPYRMFLPGAELRQGDNRIAVRVWNTAGNKYYHDTPYQPATPAPSGMIGAPTIEARIEVEIRA